MTTPPKLNPKKQKLERPSSTQIKISPSRLDFSKTKNIDNPPKISNMEEQVPKKTTLNQMNFVQEKNVNSKDNEKDQQKQRPPIIETPIPTPKLQITKPVSGSQNLMDLYFCFLHPFSFLFFFSFSFLQKKNETN